MTHRERRWPRLRRMLVMMGVFIFLAIVLFVQALLVSPQLRLPASVRRLKGQLKAIQQQEAQKADQVGKVENQSWQKFFPKTIAGQEHLAKVREALHPKPEKFSEIRLGFYANWDENSYTSLQKHADQLTHVCPEWMTLTDGEGTLKIDDDVRVQRLAAAKGIVLMPLLTNQVDDVWQPENVEGLAMGPDDRKKNSFIVNLLAQLEAAKAGGVIIDWEELDPQRRKEITDLLIKMADALHTVDKELWVEVQMGDEFNVLDLERLAEHADHYIAMLDDETSDTDPPGPIASQDWFDGWLHVLAGYGEPDLWIGALGAYGYDWTQGSKRAETISFADAMSRAGYAQLARVDSQPPMYNPIYSYQDEKDHTVCFLDAVTFLNQVRALRAADLGGLAIGRLGQEDPQVWDVLAMKDTEKSPPRNSRSSTTWTRPTQSPAWARVKS